MLGGAALAACIAAICGCTAMLRPVSERPSPDYALLVFGVEDGRQATARDGILAVDGADLREGQRKRVYVAKGLRRIGYECPGWVAVDGPATIDKRFKPGKRYRLVCGSGPVRIERAPP